MIKVETLGMIEVAKLNPVLQVNAAVKNYQFVTNNGIVYLVCNTVVGDNAYMDEITFEANEYLNGYQVDAWVGQKLVADEKHIAYASSEDYSKLTAGTTLMTIDSEGKLAVASGAPESGIYFKVVEKTMLTEKAVKLLVMKA